MGRVAGKMSGTLADNCVINVFSGGDMLIVIYDAGLHCGVIGVLAVTIASGTRNVKQKNRRKY